MSTSFSHQLPRHTDASAEARAVLRARLDAVVPAATLADVMLAVSELVSNAVRHGQGQIELRVEATTASVKAEVIDEGGGFEHELRTAGFDEIGGRGLQIVGQIADTWGVHEGTTHVWFELPLPCASDARSPVAEGPTVGRPDDHQLPHVD